MSYDLFFLVPKGEEPPGLDQLDDYFNARPNFTRVEDEFWYRNEATGVYFGFSHGDAGALEEEFGEPLEEVEDGLVAANLSFNLNYFRPPFFGLEAVIEVSALVRHFGFKVDDPQMDGMGRGEFSEEGFLRGWNFGNLLGYHAYLSPRPDGSPSKGRASVPQLPESELERIWGWNYRRRELQDRLGDDVYVALVRPLLQDGVLSSMIVWGDGISEVLPEVDQVVFYRDQLGPRKLFRRRKDTSLCSAQACFTAGYECRVACSQSLFFVPGAAAGSGEALQVSEAVRG